MENLIYDQNDLLEDIMYEQQSTYCKIGHKICFNRFIPDSSRCLNCLSLERKVERSKAGE